METVVFVRLIQLQLFLFSSKFLFTCIFKNNIIFFRLEKQSERGIREFRRSLVTEHVLARSSLRGQLEKMEKVRIGYHFKGWRLVEDEYTFYNIII